MAVSRKIWGRASKYQLAVVNNQAAEPPDEKLLIRFLDFAKFFENFFRVVRRRWDFFHPRGKRRRETANRTGPINRPIIPKAIKPPITPERIRISGKSAPMRINIGRMTLSSVPTTPLHTNNTVPGGIAGPVEPDNRRNQYRQRSKLDKAGEDH